MLTDQARCYHRFVRVITRNDCRAGNTQAWKRPITPRGGQASVATYSGGNSGVSRKAYPATAACRARAASGIVKRSAVCVEE